MKPCSRKNQNKPIVSKSFNHTPTYHEPFRSSSVTLPLSPDTPTDEEPATPEDHIMRKIKGMTEEQKQDLVFNFTLDHLRSNGSIESSELFTVEDDTNQSPRTKKNSVCVTDPLPTSDITPDVVADTSSSESHRVRRQRGASRSPVRLSNRKSDLSPNRKTDKLVQLLRRGVPSHRRLPDLSV